jgi:branched-chain amino acid transport system ATP-binding protein
MKITEILVESERIDEGPLGSLTKAAGRGVGNVIGGVAKTAGAVKGAVRGAVDRAKSSFKSGDQAAYSALAGKGSAPAAPAPAGPAGASAGGGIKKFASDFKKGFTGQTDEPAAAPAANKPTVPAAPAAAAKPETPAAEPAAAPAAVTAAPAPKATPAAAQEPTDSNYAGVKKAIAGFDAAQKKEVLAYLLSDPKVKSAIDKTVKPAAPATPAPAATPALAAAQGGEEKPAAAGKKRKTPKAKIAPSQAEIDADRDRLIQPQYDSVNRKGKAVTESFSLYRKR